MAQVANDPKVWHILWNITYTIYTIAPDIKDFLIIIKSGENKLNCKNSNIWA